jgi:hypothetical protein
MRLDTLERLLAGIAILMSAAALGSAYLFRFSYSWSAFDRLSHSLGFVVGPWVIAGVVTGLIVVGGQVLKLRIPVTEVFFTLVFGACAVSILEAFR